ncbi:hypothetical protein COCC4DRAFT_75027 [Bipolaris maydis ATCC 48331]|uniref:Transcription factor domain-containing protein n=2 Tax=Cochliobolus heterostrophus TaxID=5016 RepID=M2TJE5_COCH5|nr:uncharacterized protein COCC4DRAFT_75027 [Bipolaris maydis ATCC 48331]EMD97555.1 hypothetical protein COCHEDRAFT_1164633 [Bipolaris maydis C5]KAJ5031001.1 hypothetical protein J3E73DRAFT_428259 [Bipolaris maydis]ENI01307.1 hypothetical protein COCC4DRAFT_75027 [Bipolaris maydis ATCC 48331]KAJ5046977.1 hypothetical protein J3E74DRAFT_283515 [Bipolaris maydis]KAJ5052684.1 hypothetical protein J3E74DRAFT_282131 [Bipolaris maydis]
MTSQNVQFDFIISDPVSNLKPGKSLQIRSRCMLGRNKREGSRRTQREKRKIANAMVPRVPPNRAPRHSTTLSPPEPLIKDIVRTRFSGRGIDPEAEMLLADAFTFNFLANDVTPLERCTNLNCLESACFSWLFTDTTFLHSMLCASYAIKDFKSPQSKGNPGVQTTFHLQETLSLLRIKMQKAFAHQDESVLRVIINLTLLAIGFGDWATAATHLEGLREIVQLRGDAAFLEERPTLHYKLDRIDLAWSLASGRKPYFMQPIKSWDCRIRCPYPTPPPDLYQPPAAAWDYRIVNVFKDFQNLATFQLPGHRIPYDWVVEQLRTMYITADSDMRQDKSLLLWGLLTASITVARIQDTWIRDALRTAVAGLEWKDVQAHVSRVMWIEIVHNKPGQKAYDRVSNVKSHTWHTS